MEISKETLKFTLSHAIRNCNRNIYEWMEKTKRGSKFTISHTEVRGLVKNWIIRSLKDGWGYLRVDKMMRSANLVVSVDDGHGCISGVALSNISEWEHAYRDVGLIKDVFNEMNFDLLRYDPKDYVMDSTCPVDDLYGSPAFADFSKIERVTF